MNSKPLLTDLPKGGAQDHPEKEDCVEGYGDRADDDACCRKRFSAVFLGRLLDLRQRCYAENQRDDARNRTETACEHYPGNARHH